VDRRIAFFGTGVSGGELREGGGLEEIFVASADAGVAGVEAGFFHEPGITGGRAFEEKRDLVEEIQGEVGGGGLFAGEALEKTVKV
jgi:hypothetical protein